MREDHVTGQAHLTVALPGCVLYPWVCAGRGDGGQRGSLLEVHGTTCFPCLLNKSMWPSLQYDQSTLCPSR